jgi:hypothetical protein
MIVLQLGHQIMGLFVMLQKGAEGLVTIGKGLIRKQYLLGQMLEQVFGEHPFPAGLGLFEGQSGQP